MLRNRLFVPVVLILSLLLPTAAFAGHGRDRGQRSDRGNPSGRHHRAPVDDGFITVRNRNEVDLEVLVNGKVQGDVEANSVARFGPFPDGKHRVRVRFNRRDLRFPVTKQRVWVGDHPVRVDVPVADVGLLLVSNDWIEPMTVVHNGRVIGTIEALDERLFQVKGAYGRVELRTPKGTAVITKRIDLQGLERDRLALVPPSEGMVTIVNPSQQHGLEITCARGSHITTLRAGGHQTIQQPAGEVTLTASYRGMPIQTAKVFSSPWDRHAWTISLPTHSTLGVRNPNRFPVAVYIGGEYLATVQGQDKLMLDGVPVGFIEVQIEGHGRRGTLEERVATRVDPLSGGFLPIPELRVADGRSGGYSGYNGSDAGSCDRDRSAEAPVYRRRARSAQGYASR